MLKVSLPPVRILVVEDREEDYRFLSLLLSRPGLAETYELDWAKSYDEGFERLARGGYDAGLFDYSLGTETGLDLLRRASAGGVSMPILLLTGVDNPRIDEEALRHGAADYLCKVGLGSVQLERAIRYARKQAEILAELRRTNHLLDSVLSSLPVIAGRIDGDGTLLEARGLGLRQIGLTEAELVGTRVLAAWPEVAAHVRHALDGGETSFTRAIVRHGEAHYFDNYLRFDSARGRGAIGFAVNVTARVVAETERRRQAQLLQSILRGLPALAGRLDPSGRVVEVHGDNLQRPELAPAQLRDRVLAELFPHGREAVATARRNGRSTSPSPSTPSAAPAPPSSPAISASAVASNASC